MNRDYYARLLDELGRETIARYDREESGRQHGGTMEHEQSGGCFTFSALPRDKQTAILDAIATNLPTKLKRVNHSTGTSYGLKHAIERYTGFYVSNLQAKVAFRILGYSRDEWGLNPCFNISRREWRAFSDLSLSMWHQRHAA